MKKQVKLALIAVATLAVIGILWVNATKAIEVELDEIRRAELIDTFREEGLVEAEKASTIYVPFNGTIKAIASDGDFVDKGDVILVMDTQELLVQEQTLAAQIGAIKGQYDMNGISQNQVDIARLALDSAKLALENAKLHLERISGLYELGGASKAELEEAQTLYDDAKRNVEAKTKQRDELSKAQTGSRQYFSAQSASLEAQLADVRDKISKAQVLAPIDGFVKNSDKKPGEYVQSVSPILELSGDGEWIVSCEVLTEKVTALSVGQEVKVIQKTHSGDREYRARIIHINEFAHKTISALGLEEQRIELKAKLIEGTAQLGDGYGVTVEFETFHKEVVAIGRTTYFEEDGKNYVWRVNGGKAEKVEIKIGYIGAYEVELLDGLAVGDRIVADPNNNKLEEGVRIKEAK